VWLNDGWGAFADSGQAMGANATQHLALGDVDRDGDLDIVAGNSTYSVSDPANRVWTNAGAVPNKRPGAPGGLGASPFAGGATFSWTAATDAETPQASLTYNLRVGTAPGKDDVVPAQAFIGGANDGLRKVPAMGNVQHSLSWTVWGLTSRTYYWSVQAVDAGFAGSAWAAERTVTVP
jgi:hypothetical protein